VIETIGREEADGSCDHGTEEALNASTKQVPQSWMAAGRGIGFGWCR